MDVMASFFGHENSRCVGEWLADVWKRTRSATRSTGVAGLLMDVPPGRGDDPRGRGLCGGVLRARVCERLEVSHGVRACGAYRGLGDGQQFRQVGKWFARVSDGSDVVR